MGETMSLPLKHFRALAPMDLNELKQADVYRYSRENPMPPINPAGRRLPQTTIGVVNQDCLAAAQDLSLDGKQLPAVLNMANEFNCGGGFERTRGSQEEYLFRNTTLSSSLWPHRRENDERWSSGSALLGRAESFYPLTEHGGVYSGNVQVIGIHDQPIEQPFKCGILTIAAQDLRPGRNYNKGNTTFDPALLREKLRTCMSMALANNHKALVLGALGCGAFHNPPRKVAEAFKELLMDDGEFVGVFETVVFAIVMSQENLTAFESVFGPSVRTASALLDSAQTSALGTGAAAVVG